MCVLILDLQTFAARACQVSIVYGHVCAYDLSCFCFRFACV